MLIQRHVSSRRQPCEDRDTGVAVRRWIQKRIYKPKSGKDCWSASVLRAVMEPTLPNSLKRNQPFDTFILDFCAPRILREYTSVALSHLVCGPFFTATLANTYTAFHTSRRYRKIFCCCYLGGRETTIKKAGGVAQW